MYESWRAPRLAELLREQLRQALTSAFSEASKTLPQKIAPDPAHGHREPPGALTPAVWRHHVVGIVKRVLAERGLGLDAGALCAKRCGINFGRREVWVNVDAIVEAITASMPASTEAPLGPSADRPDFDHFC